MRTLQAVFILCALTTFAFKVVYKSESVSGTYELVSKTAKKGDDVYGYAGEIQVKELPKNRIILSFFITKGAPSYNLGSFVDTLDYSNSSAVYKIEQDSIRCEISFLFNDKGIQVKQESNDDYYGCGFGDGVVAHGFFKRVSNEVPIIKDLATGEGIK